MNLTNNERLADKGELDEVAPSVESDGVAAADSNGGARFEQVDGADNTDLADSEITVEYAGEWIPVREALTIGRDADLDIDDNPFLHRCFLQLLKAEDMWWLANVGSRLVAIVTDGVSGMQAQLAPGARLPIVFRMTTVIFSAGQTTYDFTIHCARPSFIEVTSRSADWGSTTVGTVPLTPSQKLLILSLAEPMLLHEGTGMSAIPTSSSAAARLGWRMVRFNRKLDNVCDKLDRSGVPGLRGGVKSHATNRRARLIEHAVASGLVTRADLALLDDQEYLAQHADGTSGAEE